MTHPEQSPSPTPAASVAAHWDEVYRTRAADQVSWYQPSAATSLRLITTSSATADSKGYGGEQSVIDVGAGASTLVDELLDAGYRDVTALDVSAEALVVTRRRLGPRADQVTFVVGDVLTWRPDRSYHTWHDRAVLHFLTDPTDRARYARLAADAVAPGGVLILAGFAPDGPTHCSGLPTAQRSAEQLAAEFAEHFALEHSETERHRTPSGTGQAFTWVRLRRTPADHPSHARPPLEGTS